MTTPLVMDFEEFAALHGAMPIWGDAGLHCGASHVGRNTRNAQLRAMSNKDTALANQRDELRKVYAEKIASGDIREPTSTERYIKIASGHPDNESVQAARRILEKRGIPYVKGEIANEHG